MLPDNRPIGVFDSGVGGLTVLQAIQERLPGESTIYLGDLARCPYGPRPQAEVRQFARQVADMLALEGIKMLVVACNTATAAAYDWLRERYAFPVVGVISPGARRAARCTRNGRIGVAATNGTVGSGAYRVAVLQEMEHATVVQAAMSWLVPLIEQGPVTRAEVTADLLPALETMRAEEVDTLILGCTHFPLVRDLFEVAVGPGVTVVDSADTTAEEVALLLHRLDLGADEPPVHRFLVTGPARAFAERATSMFRASPPIESVDLAWDYAS